jgi:hypothetical protein
LLEALSNLYDRDIGQSGKVPTIRELLDGSSAQEAYGDRQGQFAFAAEDLLDEQVVSKSDLTTKLNNSIARFNIAHEAALSNTEKFLSMVGDLDVYVATSMRNRADFRSMADFCEEIFQDNRLDELNVRYFDPTMSAATHHEDKGLVECLMVKCTKALVLHAGTRDSFGKDAEASMALSLGKPVIIYCHEAERERFFKDVHPLSRLIEFNTGVAIGAMVTSSEQIVIELLHRIFTNTMKYRLEQRMEGYLNLVEDLTGSVVRLQTNDSLLRETFWNHYHNR